MSRSIHCSVRQVTLTASRHPNRMKIRGVLVRLDEPSTKAPNGSRGHRILVPASIAQKRLDTLIGMGLNYSTNLKQHNQQRKVGTITKAWIEGRDLHVEADVWKHDFPEAERDLKRPGLGMSMELGDIEVRNEHADVWVLTDFCFLGATILERTSAAYHNTHAIAAAAAGRSINMAEKTTAKKTGMDSGRIAQMAAEAAVGRLQPHIERQGILMESFATRLDGLEASFISFGKTPKEDDDDTEACDGPTMKTGVKAAKKTQPPDEEDDESDDEDDDEDVESAIDKGDLDDMGPGPDGEDDDKPGDMNKGAKNKGDKTSSEDKQGPVVKEGVTGSARLDAALRRERKLARENAELKASLDGFSKRFKRLEKQVTAHGTQEQRRSVVVIPSDLGGLLSKAGINAEEMRAAGQKMTTAEVDAVLQTAETAMGIRMPTEKRIQTKDQLRIAGLMEDGVVIR